MLLRERLSIATSYRTGKLQQRDEAGRVDAGEARAAVHFVQPRANRQRRECTQPLRGAEHRIHHGRAHHRPHCYELCVQAVHQS